MPVPGKAKGYEWDNGVLLGMMALYGLTAVVLFEMAVKSLDSSLSHGTRREVEQRYFEWREALRQAQLSFMRERINEATEPNYTTVLDISIHEATGLRERRAGRYHVETEAERELVIIGSGMDSGSIALSGPRGAGKTQLLRALCELAKSDPPTRLSMTVSAPVLFDRREFVLHLFARLCKLVEKEGLSTAEDAKQYLAQIRYLQTRSDERAISAGCWGLSAKRGTSIAQQPRTCPEIVDNLKEFLGKTGQALDEKDHRRLVIGIDELDRIEPAASARGFLRAGAGSIPWCRSRSNGSGATSPGPARTARNALVQGAWAGGIALRSQPGRRGWDGLCQFDLAASS
ncbi:P-loop NTPase fold protein [Streptomyces sp. NPDC056738]|uniref:P-loop NTPase fold protein n=1 Tax=Streptomyces sp. NPDC056738 TaxID=3345933 RepID=UPI00367A6A51